MNVKINKEWEILLKDEFKKEYFKKLVDFIKEEYKNYSVWPKGYNIFKAFDLCPPSIIKVVIIGQDPYHTKGVANGLAFSTNEGNRIPPSLLNIYKEIKNEFNRQIPKSADLTKWASQGVLLLNTTLTVRENIPLSHNGKGWEIFTDKVIEILSNKFDSIVFILWGAHAQKKKTIIDNNKHLVLESAHPSPFSADRGFFGNNHFVKTNNYLKSKGKKEIDW